MNRRAASPGKRDQKRPVMVLNLTILSQVWTHEPPVPTESSISDLQVCVCVLRLICKRV